MSKEQVQLSLGSDEEELNQLFSYSEADSEAGLHLSNVIAHWFNQTLRRDNFYGAWADVWYPNDSGVTDFGLKLTSPTDDISAYEQLIPKFLEAGREGLRIWNGLADVPSDLFFHLPLGLSMGNSHAIQLLHYPPITVRQYKDYLYSPTNRRVESLLRFVDYPGPDLGLVETITDLVPIAAGGDSSGSKEIDEYNDAFLGYDQAMLKARIGDPAMPVVGYGSPVRTWIETHYDMADLAVNQLVRLPIADKGAEVAVLIANHPTQYLYFTDGHDPVQAQNLLTEDLISVAWQSETGQDWSKDKDATLADLKTYWNSAYGQKRVVEIRKSQNAEYSYDHDNI